MRTLNEMFLYQLEGRFSGMMNRKHGFLWKCGLSYAEIEGEVLQFVFKMTEIAFKPENDPNYKPWKSDETFKREGKSKKKYGKVIPFAALLGENVKDEIGFTESPGVILLGSGITQTHFMGDQS